MQKFTPLENKIRPLVSEICFKYISQLGYLITQIAKPLKISYRMNVMINNLNRIAEISEGANAVT